MGVTDKWWADAFFITASYNKVKKDVQTRQVQNHVIGMADRRSDAWSVACAIRKTSFLIKNLNANLSLSHTWDHTLTTDTAHRKYDWNGDWISSARNEINGRAFSHAPLQSVR